MIGPIIEFPKDNNGYTLLKKNEQLNIPFIHTYMFALNAGGFELFKEVIQPLTNDKTDNIDMERKITSFLLINNKKIYSFLMRFKNIDINNPSNWDASLWSNAESCYEIPKNYFGIDVHPLEVIFVKNIRNPHEHRGIEISGISDDLNLTLFNYIDWNKK